jgi:ubiquinone/menaquinone biosynthesis C-methylase UbiE
MQSDEQAAEDFLTRWKEVSGKDMFEKRMFLEDFGAVWNKIWNRDVSSQDAFGHKLFMRRFASFDRSIPNDYAGKILALSAGTGKAGIRLARHLPKSSVTIASDGKKAVEVIKILLSELALTNTEAALADTEKLPFEDNTFDMVFFDTIEGEFPDYEKTFSEVARVLKPGGRAIMTAINSHNYLFKVYASLAGSDFEYHYTRSFSKGEIKKLFRKQKLFVTEEKGFDLGYGSYVSEDTEPLSRFLGRVADRIFRILNKISFGGLTDDFGLGLLVILEKPIDKNAAELAAMANIVEEVKQPLPDDSVIKRVEIIVLKYKDPEVEWRAAKHILENTEWPYKMNFFDNRPGTKNMAKAWNKLIRESTCDYIVIMDSDVFVPKLSPDWLTRLMGNFIHEDCYVSLPKVTVTSCPEQKAQKAEDKPAHIINARFAGMCVLYKKEIFEKVGYFDEEFLLRGSDVEWVDRLLKSPYKAYISPDVLVDHVGSYASKKAGKQEVKFNRALERIYANTLFNKKVR